jgi:dTDP-4-amino-4,6-dideoxygalactose transaminase
MAGGVALADYRKALSCALSALAIPAGENVLCSALASTAHRDAIEDAGMVPMVVDVSSDSGVMDLHLADEVRGMARAVLIDHSLGFVPNLTHVLEWDLPTIEEVTCSLGGYDGDKAQGPRADIAILSLGYSSLLTAASGALLLCKTRSLLAAARAVVRDRAELLADLNASLALAQLKRYDGDIQTRHSIREAFNTAITRTRHRTLSLPHDDEDGVQVPFSYPVVVSDGAREVQRYAAHARIETYMAYKRSIVANARLYDGMRFDEADDVLGNSELKFNSWQVADSLARRCMLFPLYPLLGEERVQAIAKILATLP